MTLPESRPRPWYAIGLSYVGGREYLWQALASLGEKHWPYTHVLNNSDPRERLQSPGKWADWQEEYPHHPLTHTQSVNVLLDHAAGLDAAFLMHCDAEAEPDTIDKLLEMSWSLPKKWAAVFTNYDSLAMYNPKAIEKIGPWDWQNFPSYYSDNDWYRRLALAGWSTHESGLPVKHIGSHVINRVDKWRKFRTAMNMENWERVYRLKWGGKPGEEIFKIPFNLPLGPYPDD